MCSTDDDRLAELGQAIDDLAARSQAQPGATSDKDTAGQVAYIWAMLAELDPELASRMAGYDKAAE
ncbi:MAG TPA: hypothetical protein VH637_05650 [Streptosporangiaceae bacterium]|jgi:hypothetical protein